MTKEQLFKKFPKVFSPRVGCLKGGYYIRLNPQCTPIQRAPRRVHVVFRDCLKEKLDQTG